MEEAKKAAKKPKNKTKKQKQSAHRIRLAVSILLVVLLTLGVWCATPGAGMDAFVADVFGALAAYVSPQTDTPASAPVTLPDEPFLDVYVFDVGQGDSILLISPTGQTMLVDTGESEYVYRLDSRLKALGISRIDALVASHPHSDHIGGMRQLIQTYDIGDFYMPDASSTSNAYEGMLAALYDKNVPSHILYAGDAELPYLGDDVTVELLSPWRGARFSELNDMSLVFRISYGESSILLTGDAGAYAEELAVNMQGEEVFSADVLKVAHHGSDRGLGAELIAAVAPKYAVISCGENNDYGHPTPGTLKLLDGVEVYRTDQNGTVRILLTASDVLILPERP